MKEKRFTVLHELSKTLLDNALALTLHCPRQSEEVDFLQIGCTPENRIHVPHIMSLMCEDMSLGHYGG